MKSIKKVEPVVEKVEAKQEAKPESKTKKVKKTIAKQEAVKVEETKTSKTNASNASNASNVSKPSKKSKKMEKIEDVGDTTEEVAGEAGAVEVERNKIKFYRVHVDGFPPRGRFSGKKPKQAATKAYSSSLKFLTKNGVAVDGELRV